MTDGEASVRSLSLHWEEKTGYDSIPTIERMYDRSEGGAYQCTWPRCHFARKDPVKLWRHVHSAHGERSLPPEV